MRFTVNIATYNQLDSLRLALDALECQTFKDFDISVTDDGSSDGTKEYMEKNRPNVRYYWYEKDGFQLAKSKNIGIKNAVGEYFLSMEADVIPHFKLLEAYNKYAEPNTIIYGLRHDIKKAPKKLDFDKLDDSVIGLDFRLPDFRRFEDVTNPWRLCSGCNVLFPLEKLKEAGGWNEAFKFYGYDDYEVCARLYADGCNFLVCPSAYGYHVKHDIHSSKQVNEDILIATERRLGLI